jgi:hypothetical protein
VIAATFLLVALLGALFAFAHSSPPVSRRRPLPDAVAPRTLAGGEAFIWFDDDVRWTWPS